jgi:hypothetical protein
MTDAREDRTNIEVRWSDDTHVITLNVAAGDETAEVYLGADEARALGETLIRAADTERLAVPARDARWLAVLEEEAARRGLPPGPGVHHSIRFSTRYWPGPEPGALDQANDATAT